MRQYEFGKVVTHCPHCLHTIGKEYAKFEDGDFETVHHTELLADLLRTGKLKPSKNIDIKGMGEQFFILYVSSYGTPTAVLHYNDHKNNRIVTLNGEIQYDGPKLKLFGWNGLLLHDQQAYYDFDTKLKDTNDNEQFELVITRFNYGKDSVEEKRILIEPPKASEK